MKRSVRPYSQAERDQVRAVIEAAPIVGGRHLLWSLALVLLAAACGRGAFRLIASQVLVAALLGIIAAVLAGLAIVRCMGWVIGRGVDREFRAAARGALTGGEAEVIEFEATQAWSAPEIDDDAPAVLLADAEGWRLYVNTHDEGMLEDPDHVCGRWEIVRSVVGGFVFSVQEGGAKIPVSNASNQADELAFKHALGEVISDGVALVRAEQVPGVWPGAASSAGPSEKPAKDSERAKAGAE
ncbi:MAG: hypothetical protein JSR77_14020 [Planctomycetes bacterium]|nr:hypothetical protein [Planctomycetota bacterium]